MSFDLLNLTIGLIFSTLDVNARPTARKTDSIVIIAEEMISNKSYLLTR